MGLFSRKPKRRLIGFNVVFEKGGRTYTYQKTREQMQEYISDRYAIRGSLPYSVEAIFSDGSTEPAIAKEA